MTVKSQWTIVIVASICLTLAIHTLVLSYLIQRYFVDYTTENYYEHVDQLQGFAQKALTTETYSSTQLDMQLESHLSDPIIGISLYDDDGNILANVSSFENTMNGMMGGHMMNHMLEVQADDVDSYEIINDEAVVGYLYIYRYSSIGNSIDTQEFRASLVSYSLIIFLAILLMSVGLALYISSKMSKDLSNTAQMALNIELNEPIDIKDSKTKEIRTIQQQLKTLDQKLKIRRISRKKVVDELMHQSRTPLTVLKSYFEGYKDGVITFDDKEVANCEFQIEALTSMIGNINHLIDAQRETDSACKEDIDLSTFLEKIVLALDVQFQKKEIELNLHNKEKLHINTDPYKLTQIIYNLLTNAYKYTEAGGKVEVSYIMKEEAVHISVTDTGQGMTEDTISHIYEPYYRGDFTGKIDGEGLGMYIVKENLERIEGQIIIESSKGTGSRMTIILPKA